MPAAVITPITVFPPAARPDRVAVRSRAVVAEYRVRTALVRAGRPVPAVERVR